MPEVTQRRLAAIVSTDVVGYSRLMGSDEADTLARMKAHRQELWSPVIQKHGGRVVGAAGDSLLVEYSSAVSAVESAVEVQLEMRVREAKRPDEKKMLLRIGVNIGEVVVEGDEIYGDGVNVAARLQALAPPGGVCISGKVHEEIDGKMDAVFTEMGEHQVKNIARPVRVLTWLASEPAPPIKAGDILPPLEAIDAKPALAVLPFENISGDAEQDYFADGISEDIINGLAMWRSFPVIARNSSFAFRGQDIDARSIGSELNAQYLLEGSIRRAADRVRVTAQLIEAKSGHHVWANKFDRPMREIFELQDEIVERIVAATAPEVLRAEGRRATQKRPDDLNAWDFILRAMSAKSIGQGYGTKEGNAEAKRCLEKSLALKPSAEAWAWRALCEWHDAINGWVDDSEAALTRCIDAALYSMNEDDANWQAHSVLGIALLFGRGETAAAVDEAAQGVQLNPSSSSARHILGCALDFAGNQQEAVTHLEAVFQLDPRYSNRAAAYADLALSHLLLGDHEAALGWARKTAATDPDYVRGRQRLVAILQANGHSDEARQELAAVRRAQPGFSLDYVKRTYPFADAGQAAAFANWLIAAGVT